MNQKEYREKIRENLDFNCECGYNFINIIDDVQNMPMVDYNKIMNGYLPCVKCGKDFPIKNIKLYIRKKKIDKILKI